MLRILSFALCAALLAICLCGCVSKSKQAAGTAVTSSKGTATYDWEVTGKKYRNFTDLGDYVIGCNPHTDFDFDKALAYSNARYDKSAKTGGCTALATKTDKGDVIIGRNLDLTVSQFPCYITHVKYGKNVYTMIDKSAASGWNLCYLIGDATGEYGLVEIP